MKRFILASTLIAISANATVILDEVSSSTQITPDMMTSSFTITKKQNPLHKYLILLKVSTNI